jgi:hypothetical protein
MEELSPGQPISRILSGSTGGLHKWLHPAGSLPGWSSVWALRLHSALAAYPRLKKAGRFPLCRGLSRHKLPLLGLAPNGGCLAAPIAGCAGGLLHHLFILTGTPRGYSSGLFLWPDPAGFPAPGVTRHPALWSADFPRPPRREAATTQPTWAIHDTIRPQ